MDLLEKFRQFIKKNDLFSEKDRLLIAVSGGVDSVVLCELMKLAGYEFGIAHCNFQLRGKDSERDENFVKALAGNYKVKFFVKRFETEKIAAEKKRSIQETARELRYEWFNEILESVERDSKNNEKPFARILTAHHADDNIETLLINFFRGTGVRGLKGMEPRQGKLVRPLLFARRKELEDFLTANNLRYVQDVTNLENDYTRNYFRNQLIPALQKVFPSVDENLLDNISRFREVAGIYEEHIRREKKSLLEQKGNEIHIPILKLKKSGQLNTIIYEIIKDFNFTPHQVKDTVSLMDSEPGKFVQSSSHRIIKDRRWLIISPLEPELSDHFLIEGAGKWNTGAGKLEFSIQDRRKKPEQKLAIESSKACLDAEEVKFPLLLRKWKQGDYFYPLGMRKKKKLSRFFIDQKLSKTEKERTWVIEMDKKILWVVGHRIDDRFKLRPDSKKVLEITRG